MDAFLIFFFNGVFLEFGDELFCMILAEPTGFGSFQSCHRAAARAIEFGAENRTFLALAGGIMGYAFAPTYYVYVSMNGPPKTAGETFKVLFLVEAFEGAVSVVGQVATDGNLSTALIPLLFILPIGFAKGAIFAFIFAWKTSELFKFQVILFLGIVLAIAYYAMGGGDLLKSENAVTPTLRKPSTATQPVPKPTAPPKRYTIKRPPIFQAHEVDLYAGRDGLFVFHGSDIRWNIDFIGFDARSSRMTFYYSDGSYADLGVKIQCLVYPRFLRGNTVTVSKTKNRETVATKTVPLGVINTSYRWPLARKDDGRSRIGATIKNIYPDDRTRLGWASSYGVLTGSIVNDSPAARSGIQRNDIIVAMNGRLFETATEAQTCIGLSPPETILNFEVFRNGRNVKIPVRLK